MVNNHWLVVWNHGILRLSIYWGNFIIPTEQLIFFRGVLNHQPDCDVMTFLTQNYATIVMAHDFYDIVEKYYSPCATFRWSILSKSISTHESTSHHGPAARLTAWAMLRATRAATFTEKNLAEAPRATAGFGCLPERHPADER